MKAMDLFFVKLGIRINGVLFHKGGLYKGYPCETSELPLVHQRRRKITARKFQDLQEIKKDSSV